MSLEISFYAKDKELLNYLKQNLNDNLPESVTIEDETIQPALGLGESFFSYDAILSFLSDVASRTIATLISSYIIRSIDSAKAKRHQKSDDKSLTIEIKINGKRVDLETLEAAIAEAVKSKTEQKKQE